MPICETCKHWRELDRTEGFRPKHPRGRCASLDARVPVGPDHSNLTTFADFGCVAHEAVVLPPIAFPAVDHKIQ